MIVQEVQKLEMKLSQARDLLSSETSLRRKAEGERDSLGQKWELVRELITDHGQTMNDDTRHRLAKLEASVSTSRRYSKAVFSPGGPFSAGADLSPVSERDSTASILDASDLSFDYTRDSLVGACDESRTRSGRNYKRKSSGGIAQLNKNNRRSRSNGGVLNRKSLEAMAAAKKSGVFEEENNKKRPYYEERNIDDYVPSAPAASDDDAVVAW